MTDPTYDLEKLVTIQTYPSPWEAQLARARLDAEGIHAVIAGENFVHLYSALAPMVGGVQLQVREEDAARATEVLGTLRPIPEIYLVTEEDADAARELEASMPDEVIDLVVVARFGTPWEAHLARTLLESEGIDACVFEERLPPLDLLTGRPLALNRVEVHPDDAERALEILAEAENAEGAAEELP
jgi:hypothetical protein